MRVVLACPNEGCTGKVGIPLTWEPPEPNYGADADGNRGVSYPGFWYCDPMPENCSAGCVLTDAQQDALDSEAIAEANSGGDLACPIFDEPDEDYYELVDDGPDFWTPPTEWD